MYNCLFNLLYIKISSVFPCKCSFHSFQNFQNIVYCKSLLNYMTIWASSKFFITVHSSSYLNINCLQSLLKLRQQALNWFSNNIYVIIIIFFMFYVLWFHLKIYQQLIHRSIEIVQEITWIKKQMNLKICYCTVQELEIPRL